MDAVVVKLRSRWAAALADARLRHLAAVLAALLAGKAVSKLCVYLPVDFEKPCHLASAIAARLTLLLTGGTP